MTTPTTTTDRKRTARLASALHAPRCVARGLLAIPAPIRADVLAELVRVGPGAMLAACSGLPSRPSVEKPRP